MSRKETPRTLLENARRVSQIDLDRRHDLYPDAFPLEVVTPFVSFSNAPTRKQFVLDFLECDISISHQNFQNPRLITTEFTLRIESCELW